MGKSLKGRELGVGITQRKDGRYQARFTDSRGKRQTLYSNSYREIQNALTNAMEEDRTRATAYSTMTLNDWYDIWITTFKTHCRKTTRNSYKIQYDRVRDSLGQMRLCDIDLLSIQMALNKLKTDKSKGDTRAILIDLMNHAVANDLMAKNFALYTKKSTRQPTKEKTVLSKEEAAKLVDITKGTPYMHDLIIFGLSTGMRIGEILGLCTDDVDLDARTVTIRHTLVYLPGDECRYVLHDPKTKASARVVPLTDATYEAMVRLLERKKKLNRKFSTEGIFEKLIFVSRTNKPINECNVKKQFLIYGERIGVPELTPHVLRHTFATNCIENGMTPKVLQHILGHASLSITMDRYCHVRTQTMRDELTKYTPQLV